MIKSRMISDSERFVLTICTIHAGTAKNVFPDECVMEGTMRVYTVDIVEKLK